MLTALCIFCATAAMGFHIFLGEPSGPIAILSLFASWILSSDLALWVQADAVQRGIAVAYDFDSLFFLLWPLAAFIYLYQTRGWRALAPIGLFMLLLLAGLLFAAVLAYPQSAAYLHAHMS
jgi:hypothetical protein